MKKCYVFWVSGGILLLILALGFSFVYPGWFPKMNEKKAIILNRLPFEVEKNNPIPEVRNWDLGGRTFYYFNWGIKQTGGYSLELDGVTNDLIKIKAKVPKPGQMLIQVLTFPYLLVSLPKGNYEYQVNDEQGKVLENFFTPANPPLKLTVYLPHKDRIAKRLVLRDPYWNTEGKTTALIALEALFNQEEMLDFVDHEVLPEDASFSIVQKSWYVLLSRGYQYLPTEEKKLLNELITKTVLELKVKDLTEVIITTDPTELPPLNN